MSHISIPVQTEQFFRLADFLRQAGSAKDPVQAIEQAIDYWLDNAAWKKEDLLPDVFVDAGSRGYMWKKLFLPHGTLLRIRTRDSFQYAKVEGDHLIYKGEHVSPNQFALKATGSARDAWRDLWIKRPSDQDYIHAQDLREPS